MERPLLRAMNKVDLKDELALLINEKVTATGLSYRDLSAKVASLSPATLTRISQYCVDKLTVDKLVAIINDLDLSLTGKIPGFQLHLKRDGIQLVYRGQSPSGE